MVASRRVLEYAVPSRATSRVRRYLPRSSSELVDAAPFLYELHISAARDPLGRGRMHLQTGRSAVSCSRERTSCGY